MEEIGSQPTFLTLEGVKGQQRPYIRWLLGECTAAPEHDVLTDAAADLPAERLVTPFQITQYLTLTLEEAYKVGQKPISGEMIEQVLAQDMNGLEPTLTRHGYSLKVLAEWPGGRPAEIRSFL
jgi:hypothetical protein